MKGRKKVQYDIRKMKKIVKERLSEKRFNHCVNVSKMAKKLAKIYNVDEKKAEVAGLLHDIAKELTNAELVGYAKKYKLNCKNIPQESINILHAEVGAKLAKEFLDIDEDVEMAISYHTVGNKDMNLLEKIVFIADKISEERDYTGVDNIREYAMNNQIDKAIHLFLERWLVKIKEKGKIPNKKSLELLEALSQ